MKFANFAEIGPSMDDFDFNFNSSFILISPFLASAITGWITYYFAIKRRKFDLIYQNKIMEHKNIVEKLVAYKKFCMGRVAYLQGNEFSPYWEEGAGTLHHRGEISNIAELNTFYLSKKSKKCLDDLINEMSILCNVELCLASGQGKELGNIRKPYEIIIEKIENCINTLYKDL